MHPIFLNQLLLPVLVCCPHVDQDQCTTFVWGESTKIKLNTPFEKYDFILREQIFYMSNGNVPRGEVNTPNLNRTYPHPTSCLSWAVFKDWIKRPQTLTHCFILKALDTFGNCQRPVFLLGVPQHMHKITNLRKILAQLVFEFARE